MMFGYIEILTPSYQADAADDDRYKAENALVLNSKNDFLKWRPQLQWLREQVNVAKTGPAVSPGTADAALAAAPSEDDFTVKLERLAKLHEAGAITEDEFRAGKQRLL